MIFVQNAVGLAFGVVVGCGAWFFKFIDNWKYVMHAKTLYCFLFSIGFMIASGLANFPNAKYLSTLSLGYVCNRFWG